MPAAPPDLEEALATEIGVDSDDPEVARVRASIASRLLGAPLVEPKIGRFVVLERLGAGGMGIVYAAFDPRLDRKVAIKLLFRHEDESAERVRMLREAQAMAKLAHPNVAYVYEVGEHGGRTFVAMELVRGTTLTRWLAEQPRPRHHIIDVCLQAGRGLAAAHREGIVHRDFKPDNILIGDDGRVRVVDFGLARVAHEFGGREVTNGDASGVPSARRTGSFAGTPGYVAPELLRGAPASASSDQFAFCVTVWEALSASMPILPDDAGRPTNVPPTIPGWIARILWRGLGEHNRHAHLDDLLRELADDPARRRAKRLWAGAAALGIASAFVVGANVHTSPPSAASCDGATELLETAWPSTARDAALGAVERTGPYGEAAAGPLGAQLEAYAASWRDAHGALCMERQRGHLTEERFDRLSVCLERGRTTYAALGRALADPPGAAIPALVLAANTLAPPSSCPEAIDREALSAEIEKRRLPLIEVGIHMRTYQLEPALTAAQAVVARSREQDQKRVLAEALLLEAIVHIELHDRTSAVERLRESELVALRAGAEEIAIEAWGQHAWSVATETGDALEGGDKVLAMAEARPTSYATLSLYNNLAGAALGRGDRATGRAMYQRVIDLAPSVPGDLARLTAYGAMSGLAQHIEDPERRAQLFRDSIAGFEQLAGAEHPRTLTARLFEAGDSQDPRAAADALGDLCADLRRFHPGHALHQSCVRSWVRSAELADDAATAASARAEWRTLATGDEAILAKAYDALANGAPEATATLALEAIAMIPLDGGWWEDVTRGEAEVLLGRARQLMGEPNADALMERGLQRMRGDADRHTPPSVLRNIAHVQRIREGTLPLPAP